MFVETTDSLPTTAKCHIHKETCATRLRGLSSCHENPKICAFHGDSHQLSNVDGQKRERRVDGQLLARFVSRKEMLDGEAMCRTQNGYKTTLRDDENALQITIYLRPLHLSFALLCLLS